MNVNNIAKIRQMALANTAKFGLFFKNIFINNDSVEPPLPPPPSVPGQSMTQSVVEKDTAVNRNVNTTESDVVKEAESSQWVPIKLQGYQHNASMTIWQSFNSDYNDQCKTSPQRCVEDAHEYDTAYAGPGVGNCVGGCCGLHIGCCSGSYVCLFACGGSGGSGGCSSGSNDNIEKNKTPVVHLNSMTVCSQ